VDLGIKKSSLDDQHVDATQLHRNFFYPSPLQFSSEYLVKLEGQAIASGIEREQEKFMLLFGSDSGAVKYLKTASQSEAVSLMRELIDYYVDKFKSGDPSAFNLRPGVARLNRFLKSDGVVVSLRDFYHFLCSGFEPAQHQLWYQAIREVTAECDLFSVRSSFRGDIDLIKALIEDAGLGEHEQRGGIEAALYKWVQSWAKLPLMPRVSEDFAFFSGFFTALADLPDLEASDYRELLVGLCDAAVERGELTISDSFFELFRAFARSSRRIPFVQYLLKQHGRNLDLLGERLKAWVMLQVLLDDSPDFLLRFRHGLRLDSFSDDLELEPEELRSFAQSIVQKARPHRERFELDWLIEAAERLAELAESARHVSRLQLEKTPAVESLAVQLSGESHQAISRSAMKDLLVRVAQLQQQSIIVGQSANDASAVFVELFTPLICTPHAGLAFRNSSRLCLTLADACSDEWPSGSDKFRQLAQALARLRLPSSDNDRFSGKRLASLQNHELVFLSEVELALGRPLSSDSEQTLFDFLRSETAHRRYDREIFDDLIDAIDEPAAWLKELPDDALSMIKRVLAKGQLGVGLLDGQHEAPSPLAQKGGDFVKDVDTLRRYFYLFAGSGIRRVDEEYQIWLAPRIRQLVDQLDDGQKGAWATMQAQLVSALPDAIGPRLASLAYRTTGIRSATVREEVGKTLFTNFRLSSLSRPESDMAVSDSYKRFVGRFFSNLPSSKPSGWLKELIKNLLHYGDEELAWYASRGVLSDQLKSQGYGVCSREVDRVINHLAAEADGVEAAFWIEFLAEGRAYLQFLAIGLSMTERYERIAKDALEGMQSLNSLEAVDYPSASELGRMINGFGHILLEQQPSLISFDQGRFWLQEILPKHEQSKAFWRLLFIHIRRACAAGIPEEMVVTLGSWANRMTTTVENLAGFKETSREVFDPEKRAFAESRDDELAWKNAFSGVMVVSVAEEHGRLPRAWLAQQWFSSNPQVQQLSRPQWEQVSEAFEKKLQKEADPWFMPGFFAARKEVSSKLESGQLSGRGLSADEYAFVKRAGSAHARARWQSYASVMSIEDRGSQATLMTVAKLTGWPMIAESEYRTRNQGRKQVLRHVATFEPGSIKSGLLRRKPPAIPAKDMETWRARSIGMVLGAMNGDQCCQIQCLFSLKIGPMNSWEFKDFQAFAAELLQFEGGGDDQEKVVAAAWFASILVKESTELAEKIVKKWSPYGRRGAEQGLHSRCERDLGHLLAHLVHQVVGLSGLPAVDQWYQRHVLDFIGDKALEPFAELVDALRAILKKELPPAAYELGDGHLQSLDQLLQSR
jgi:hypothetical protein